MGAKKSAVVMWDVNFYSGILNLNGDVESEMEMWDFNLKEITDCEESATLVIFDTNQRLILTVLLIVFSFEGLPIGFRYMTW